MSWFCSLSSRDIVLTIYFFFFQAEDGIRDVAVTGVQTCALPICCRDRSATDWDPARWDGLVRPRGRHGGNARGAGHRLLQSVARGGRRRGIRAGGIRGLPLRPRCDAALPSAALQPLLRRVQPKRRREADRSRASDEAVAVQAARRGARPHVRVPGGHGPRGRARRSPDAGRAGRLARVVKLCDPAREAEETRFPAASKLVFNFNSEGQSRRYVHRFFKEICGDAHRERLSQAFRLSTFLSYERPSSFSMTSAVMWSKRASTSGRVCYLRPSQRPGSPDGSIKGTE